MQPKTLHKFKTILLQHPEAVISNGSLKDNNTRDKPTLLGNNGKDLIENMINEHH